MEKRRPLIKLLNFLLLFSKQQIDNCSKKYDLTVESIKNITNNIANTHTMRAIEIEQTVKIYTPLYNDVQQNIKSLIECGELRLRVDEHLQFHYIFFSFLKRFHQNCFDVELKIEFHAIILCVEINAHCCFVAQ
jgi:hypothetical protein